MREKSGNGGEHCILTDVIRKGMLFNTDWQVAENEPVTFTQKSLQAREAGHLIFDAFLSKQVGALYCNRWRMP